MLQQSTAKNKPALDEESFTRLLAAAYVMQEHQDRVRPKLSPADLTEIITQIVETQHEIQTHSYRGTEAFSLVAKRLCALTRAEGVALGTTTSSKIVYRAAAGSAAAMSGASVEQKDSLAAMCLKTGTSYQSPLAQSDPHLNAAQCRKLGAQSLLVVPLFHDGKVEGAIELYFSQVSGFGDGEVRAAELLAGVASEVIADGAEQELKDELESERASVMQAIEMLEPQLQQIATGAIEKTPATPSAKADAELCRACGHAFVGNEASCGVCGAFRSTGMYPGAALQSKWAVLWERHLTGAEENGVPLFRRTQPGESTVFAARFPEGSAQKLDAGGKTWKEIDGEEKTFAYPAIDAEEDGGAGLDSGLNEAVAIDSAVGDDFANAPAAGEAGQKNAWERQLSRLRQRPGDASLVLASGLLLLTLFWAFWPRSENTSLANASVPATSSVRRHPRPRAPKLTLFERTMVGLGLAVPPPTPEYLGDPNIKVWEDLQTALYYCPDTDLYGNTAKGRFTTQAEAQQDAFEPALRKPCD